MFRKDNYVVSEAIEQEKQHANERRSVFYQLFAGI
jgi:hypothetical protein